MTQLLLGKYEIVKILGRGGMGTVYEVREVSTGQRLAIKSMRSHPLAEKKSTLARFKQEAQIANKLDCPHIAMVYECAEDDETQLVHQVMELLEGEDLRSLLGRVGVLEPEVAVRIAAQAAAGLAAAHGARVIHRDIKPDNLFLARMGNGRVVVKVLDFGIAKTRRVMGEGDPSALSQTMTASNEVLGTPLYMAPEQFHQTKHVDARCDVYSLGVTLFTMLAGKSPYAHIKSFLMIFRAATAGNRPSLAECAPWVRPEIVAVVEKAMHKDRECRHVDGAALFEDLASLVQGDLTLHEEMLVGMNAERAGAVVKVETVGPLDETMKQVVNAETKADLESAATTVSWWQRLVKR